jgi:hypothetical protein
MMITILSNVFSLFSFSIRVDRYTDDDDEHIVYLVLTSVFSVTYSDNDVYSEMLYFQQRNEMFRSIVYKRRIPVGFRIHHYFLFELEIRMHHNRPLISVTLDY